MIRCDRGSEPVRRLLRTNLHDIRGESTATFPAWLGRHLRGWSVDAVFQQRLKIRDLRRGRPELEALELARHAARADFEAAPEYPVHERLRRELAGGENAVAGLVHARARAEDDVERNRLEEKLVAYQAEVAALRRELEMLRATSRPWQRLHEAATRLAETRAATGFDQATARLSELQRSNGRTGGRSGVAFEAASADAVRMEILPELERDTGSAGLLALHRVRLGTSRAEFDQLVVRPAADPSLPVTVVAAVEAKRNPNDLAHGFRNRVHNLDWFLGRSHEYDPADYRTARFPDGHFDRPAVHAEQGRRHVFTRDSFSIFEEDRTADDRLRIPRGLYLVSRPASLWGIGSGGLARIAHRVSSDPAFDLSDSAYVSALLDWSIRLTHRIEAPDLLRRNAEDDDAARRMLLLTSE